jgi:hypothetical protein
MSETCDFGLAAAGQFKGKTLVLSHRDLRVGDAGESRLGFGLI